MPRDTENQLLFAAAASKFARVSSARNSSPSRRYRVSIAASPDGVPLAETQVSPSEKHGASGTLTRVPSSRVEQTLDERPSDGSALSPSSAGGVRGKLPLKIRQSVSRMRSQLAVIGQPSPTNTASITKESSNRHILSTKSSTRSHKSSALGTSPPRPSITSASASSEPQYSNQSQRFHALMNDLTVRKSLINSNDRKISAPSDETRYASQKGDHAATLFSFMDLLRPIQKSMTSLQSEWLSDDDEEEASADAQFQQHERDSSRVLRVCCSVDNLLFTIGDQIQENNQDLLAVARGPALALVQLMIRGLTQVAGTIAEEADTTIAPLTAKEERHLRDFLIEVADRWSKVDELVRSILVACVDRIQSELNALQERHAELQAERNNLEVELRDVREFYANQSSAAMAMTSNFMRFSDRSGQSDRPESDETTQDTESEKICKQLMSNCDMSDTSTPQSMADEVERLRTQCIENTRLLEMAKQEIRLCHQERQAQHQRLVELSQSMLRDQEVAQLRSEIQSERKRVRNLEAENLSLRENTVDLSLKIQSMTLNLPGVTSGSFGKASNSSSTSSTTGPVAINPGAQVESLQPSKLEKNADQVQAPEEKEESSISPPCGVPATHLSVGRDEHYENPWLYRMIGFDPERIDIILKSEEDGVIRQFLTSLRMTPREATAASARSKVLKIANVSAIAPPIGSALSSGVPSTRVGSAKIRSKKPKAIDPSLLSLRPEEWATDEDAVGLARELIVFFYQRYLMAHEAKTVLASCDGHTSLSVSLPTIVLQFFLERNTSEVIAVRDLKRFILILHVLRAHHGDVRLFCEFLEEIRGSEALKFLLMVLQAINSVDIGISYDAQVSFVPGDRLGRRLCAFKAQYLTRLVYRELHMKTLKCPGVGVSTPVTSMVRKQSSSSLSPSRRRRKSRLNSNGSINTIDSTAVHSSPLAETSSSVGIVDQAIREYHEAVARNSGCPLTLEALNQLLFQFAHPTSHDELMERMGLFYQTTGDERHLPVDIFLVLLVETFQTQLNWRKSQLRALYVAIAKQEEQEEALEAQRRQEAELAAAQAASGRSKGSRGVNNKAVQEKTSPKKTTKKKKKKRSVKDNPDKYVVGLHRNRLRKLLVQSGIASTDISTDTIDMLYLEILRVIGATASGIVFDQVYDAFVHLRVFDQLSGAPMDLTTLTLSTRHEDSNMMENLQHKTNQLRNIWETCCHHVVMLSENDPNIFIRQRIQQLTRFIITPLGAASSTALSIQRVAMTMRGFLEAAGRLAVARSRTTDLLLPWSETEFFHRCAIVRVVANEDAYFVSKLDNAIPMLTSENDDIDRLQVFYDVSKLRIEDLVQEHASRSVSDATGTDANKELEDEKRRLDVILRRYALHLAHLYHSFTPAQFNSMGLTKSQWIEMAHTLSVPSKRLGVDELEVLFVRTAMRSVPVDFDGRLRVPADTTSSQLAPSGELALSKSEFVELLLRLAIALRTKGKTKHSPPTRMQRLSDILKGFCHDVIAPQAFCHRDRLQEQDFLNRLRCPLVGKALLEHRAFLRHVFFDFAARSDRDAEHLRSQGATGLAELSSKHNTMDLEEFVAFLSEFSLMQRPPSKATPVSSSAHLVLDESGAAYIFQAVMNVEKDDKSSMEFDEFAAAVVALALLHNAHPFLMWHQKIHAFVTMLHIKYSATHPHFSS